MIQDKSVNEDEIQKLTKKEKDRVKLCGNIIKSQSHRGGPTSKKRVNGGRAIETNASNVGEAKSQNFEAKKFSVCTITGTKTIKIGGETENSKDNIMALLIKRFQNKNRELEQVGCNDTDYISNAQSFSNTVNQFVNDEEKKKLIQKSNKWLKLENKRSNRLTQRAGFKKH